MDFILKVGNDNGNSEQDIYIENILYRQPNVYAEPSNTKGYDEESPIAVVENIMDKILVGIQSGSISGTYLIGKSAVDSGELLNELHVGFDDKNDSELPIINTLGTIAAYAVQKSTKENKGAIPEKITVGVEMTTALPITEYYEDPQNKIKFAENFLQGPHIVLVHVGKKRVAVDIKFVGVVVLPEASPVVLSILKDVNGDTRKGDIFADFSKEYFPEGPAIDGDYFKNKRILHTDIGDGTTELPLTEGDSPKENFFTGHNLGAGHAIREALDEIRKITHLPNLKRQEASEIIRGHMLKKWQDKTMIALKPEIQKQVKEIVKAVKEELIRAKNEVDVILVYGGGSILMKDDLYPHLMKICKKADIQLLYVPEEYAIIMNADGLNNFVHTEIFKHIITKQQEARTAANTK